MKRLSTLLVMVFVCLLGNAQDKLLTMEDVTFNYKLYPSYYRMINAMDQLQWRSNMSAYTYVHNDALFEGSVKGSKDKELLNLENFNKALEKAGLGALERFPNITWVTENTFRYSQKNKMFVFDLKKKSVALVNEWNEKAENLEVESGSLALAYTIGNNLYVSKNADKDIQITNDEDEGIVNGQYAHRREFGITKGIFWSSKGNYLAFYRKDEREVSDYPIIDFSARVAENHPVKYPMAGMSSEQVTLGVYDVNANKTIFLKTGAVNDQYLTNITWSPDEQYIYIAELNRGQDHMKLNKYDAKTGAFVKTLFEEKNKKYVEPEHGPIFFKSRADEFLWFSERNGFNHLYLYTTDGKLVEQVTDGKYDVLEFLGFDDQEQRIFYKAVDEEFPLQKHIYSINMESLEVLKLSSADGVHDAVLSDDGLYLIDIYSSSKIAHEIALINNNGMILKKIYENYNPLADYKLGEIEVGTVKADDETDLYYRIIKPVDFDASKKYPVIVYLYGGPHNQLIENSWRYGAFLTLEYWAQQGFVVFTIDNRGSSNRGLKFEQAMFRNMGTKEVEDQAKGIEFLKTKPWVDGERIGIHGWSYGGFMTISCMLKKPDLYKVGVSGAPVIDWSLYEVMYGERYMDTPEENPDGYKEANLINHVDKLKGKLMVIHGTSDETVVWQQTIQFLDAAIKRGVQLDYFVYPGQKHGVRGVQRLHLNNKIFNYFKDNL